MYLLINGTKHTVKRRIASSDTIKYLGVTPSLVPTAIAGTIGMYRNDDVLISEDVVGNYSRKLMSGELLQLTNKPALDTSSFVPPAQPPSATVVTAVVG